MRGHKTIGYNHVHCQSNRPLFILYLWVLSDSIEGTEMAERHELTLTLLVTAEEEETVIAMLNHYCFQFQKIGELEISVLDNNKVRRIRSKEGGYLFLL